MKNKLTANLKSEIKTFGNYVGFAVGLALGYVIFAVVETSGVVEDIEALESE